MCNWMNTQFNAFNFDRNNLSFSGRQPKIEDVELFRQLVSEGVSNSQLAKRFNVALSTVVQTRKRLDLPSMRVQKKTQKVDVVLDRLSKSDKPSRKDLAKELGISKPTIDKIALENDVLKVSTEARGAKIAELRKQGFTVAQTAKMMGISTATAFRTVSKLGIQIEKPTIETIVLQKISGGMCNKQIAKELNITEGYVAKIKKKYGLTKKYNKLETNKNIKWREIAEESKYITALREMYMKFKKGERTPEILDEMSKTIEHLKDVVDKFKKRL